MCWVIPLPLLRLKLIDKVIMFLRGSLIIVFSMYLALKKRSQTWTLEMLSFVDLTRPGVHKLKPKVLFTRTTTGPIYISGSTLDVSWTYPGVIRLWERTLSLTTYFWQSCWGLSACHSWCPPSWGSEKGLTDSTMMLTTFFLCHVHFWTCSW